MGSQSYRQQQYALDLADKSRDRSAPRAHDLVEVSPPRIGIVSPLKVGTSFEFSEAVLLGEEDAGLQGSAQGADSKEYERMCRDYEILDQITTAAGKLAMDENAGRKVRKTRQALHQVCSD